MNTKFSHKKWQVFRFDEICIIRSGVFTSSHPYTSTEESIPYIKPNDILFNTITSAGEYVSYDYIRRTGVAIASKESILVAVTGSNAGNIALLGSDAVVNQNVFYATIQNSLARPRYLYYYLYFKRHLLIKVSKYAIRGSHRSLQKLQIPLPSIKEQDAIIQYLDLHFREINVSIEDTKKAIDEINREKQLVLDTAFSLRMPGNSNSGWDILQLKDCGLIQAGITPNGSIKQYYGSEYPLFKPADFQQGIQLKYAETYLSLKGLKLARFVRANSLIICSSGINLGSVRISKIDGACSQQIIAFTPGEHLLPEFVYFQMNTHSFQEQLSKHSKNSTINLSAFKNLSIVVTDLIKQQSIVNRLQSDISLLERKKSRFNKKLLSLDEAKYNFLLRAFPPTLLKKADIIA